MALFDPQYFYLSTLLSALPPPLHGKNVKDLQIVLSGIPLLYVFIQYLYNYTQGEQISTGDFNLVSLGNLSLHVRISCCSMLTMKFPQQDIAVTLFSSHFIVCVSKISHLTNRCVVIERPFVSLCPFKPNFFGLFDLKFPPAVHALQKYYSLTTKL